MPWDLSRNPLSRGESRGDDEHGSPLLYLIVIYKLLSRHREELDIDTIEN